MVDLGATVVHSNPRNVHPGSNPYGVELQSRPVNGQSCPYTATVHLGNRARVSNREHASAGPLHLFLDLPLGLTKVPVRSNEHTHSIYKTQLETADAQSDGSTHALHLAEDHALQVVE